MDPAGFIREMFINGGQMLTQLLLTMANSTEDKASTPLQWTQMYIQTVEKKIMAQCGSYLTTEAFSWPILQVLFLKNCLKTELHHYWKKI